jgi:ammonium transporter Rh
MFFRPAKTNTEQRDERDERSDYPSNTFAFFGTVLCFLLFPSYNAAFAYNGGGGPQRIVINTVLALLASIVGALIISHVGRQTGNKFGPLEVHHATLAGGIAIASTSVYALPGVAALVLGFLVGVISCACYLYLTPALKRFARLVDTSGVHDLHGIPGLLVRVHAAGPAPAFSLLLQ